MARYAAALVILARLESPEGVKSLSGLASCRDHLGREVFTTILARHTDPGTAQAVNQAIEQLPPDSP